MIQGSHYFKNHTVRKPTWCDVCNKFCWGYLKQAYKCKVCGVVAHKGTCVDRANTTSHCSKYLNEPLKSSGSTPKIATLKVSKLKSSLTKIEEKITSETIIKPHRVDSFLSIVCFMKDDEYLEDKHFDCWDGKRVSEATEQNETDSHHLRYDTDDVFELLCHWMEKADIYAEKLAALKVFFQLSKNAQNKVKIFEFGHAASICNLLISNEQRGNDQPTADELLLSSFVFRILRNVLSGEAKLAFLKTDSFEKMVKYLKLMKKIGELQEYKKSPLRNHIKTILVEGGRIVMDYINTYYDKDVDITNYLCQQSVLNIVFHVVSKYDEPDLSIAPLILPDEVTLGDEIYNSEISQVFRGLYKGKSVAIKVLNPYKLAFSSSSFKKEITIMSLIKHSNACPFIGANQPENPTELPENSLPQYFPFIVMPYYQGGSLSNYIKAKNKELKEKRFSRLVIDWCTLTNFAMNAAVAIQFLHSRKIIHRDIKTTNFLIDDDFHVRVCDFGVTRTIEDDGTGKYTYIGTELWMAPEVYEQKKYGYKVDSYSFGLVLWSMVTGSSPFKKYKSKNQNINFASILISGERDTIPPYTPPELTQLIKKCWDGDPSVRPDFSQIIEELYLMKCPYRDVYFCRLYEGLLPDDLGRVLKKIASNLPKKDKINLSRVCKQFYRILQKKPSL